jgi:hypothetical protein
MVKLRKTKRRKIRNARRESIISWMMRMKQRLSRRQKKTKMKRKKRNPQKSRKRKL